MSVIAAAVEALIAAGVSGEELVAAVAKIEAAQAADRAPVRTARQERNARYYENRKARLEASKTSESVLSKTDKTLSDDDADKERVPKPLKETTQLPSEPNGSSGPKAVRRSDKGDFLPENWSPSTNEWQFALTELGSDQVAHRELLKFHNYWGGKGGDAGRKREWGRAWRNWVMKAADDGKRASSNISSFTPRDQHRGTLFDNVGAGLARVAARRGIGLGGRENGSGPGHPPDHGARSDDPGIEDADWTPAGGHRATG